MTNENIVNLPVSYDENNEVDRIVERYISFFNKSVEGVLGMCKAVWDADQLDKDKIAEFCKKTNLESNKPTYKKLTKIGSKYDLFYKHQNKVPANWTTLYLISGLDNVEFERHIEEGKIYSDMTGQEAKALFPLSERKSSKSLTEQKTKTEQVTTEVEVNDDPNVLRFTFTYSGTDQFKIKDILSVILKTKESVDFVIDGNHKFNDLIQFIK